MANLGHPIDTPYSSYIWVLATWLPWDGMSWEKEKAAFRFHAFLQMKKAKKEGQMPVDRKCLDVVLRFVTSKIQEKRKACFLCFIRKDNQMRSPNLEFRLKNRFFDLDRLRGIESNNFWSKNWRNNQNLKIFKTKVFPFDDPNQFYKGCKKYGNSTQCQKNYWNFFFLESSIGKIKKFHILIVSSSFA